MRCVVKSAKLNRVVFSPSKNDREDWIWKGPLREFNLALLTLVFKEANFSREDL